jgi:CubicO group peptidase (beta-lactamase class C family)
LSVTLLVLGCARAAELPRATPEEVGFSAQRLEYIDQFYAHEVTAGHLPGIVILIARHGKIAHLSAIGYADLGKRKPMQPDTVFRLYSMTKPIAATALMILYEEGAFELDDPISKYLPEFAAIRVLRTPESPVTDTVPALRAPTIHDLFRHTAGLMHGGEPENNAIDAAYAKQDLFALGTSLEEMVTRLAKIPLRYQPGSRFEYSVGQDVQARLVEIFSGMPFDQFLRKRLFEPLHMQDSGYQATDPSRLAAVHWWKGGKLVPCDAGHGCFRSSNPTLNATNINSYTTPNVHKGGSFGLVATAGDYWRFAQMMLNGGQFEGQRILSPSTIRYMTRDHLAALAIPPGADGPGTGWGLGFAVLKDPVAAGFIGSEGSYYWAGAADTLFWIDPDKDIVVVAMTQQMGPNTSWWPLRSQLSAMVQGALNE